MKNAFEITAELREKATKNANRRMRANDLIPAVVYGADLQPQSITLSHNEVIRSMENEAFFSHILTLKLPKEAQQVVIKDIQRHPFKPKIVHMDFQRIKANENLTMHVPVHFIGESEIPAIKAGGIISKLITDIEIRCLPANLPEYIELNVAGLEMGESKHISDLILPKGVELTIGAIDELDEEHNHAVFSVHAPRAEVEEEVVEAAPVVEGEEEIASQGEEESKAE